jgi:hypothetical protein
MTGLRDEALGSGTRTTCGLLHIEAKSLQLQQLSQSECEAGPYICVDARVLANATCQHTTL